MEREREREWERKCGGSRGQGNEHTGISSRPSAEWRYMFPFRSSGTMRSRESDMSSRTSESQFSFRVSCR